MKSSSTFKQTVVSYLKSSFQEVSDFEGGWAVKKGQRINVINTVEALLTLLNLKIDIKSFLKEKNHKVYSFLTNRFIELKNQNIDNIRTGELAFCLLGISLLKEDFNFDEGLSLLETGKCKGGGWGTLLISDEPNLNATFQVESFLSFIGSSNEVPEWLSNITLDNGCIFNLSRSAKNKEKACFGASALLAYMLTYYYKNDTSKEKRILTEIVQKIVLNDFETILNNILNPTDLFFTQDPKTGYHIFGFGLAALAMCELGIGLIHKYDLEQYLSKMNERFTNLHEKELPYILENARFINAIKISFDPFVKLGNKQIDDLIKQNEGLKEQIELQKDNEIIDSFAVINISLTYLSLKVLITSIFTYIAFRGIVMTLKPEDSLLIAAFLFIMLSLLDYNKQVRNFYKFLTSILIKILKPTFETQFIIFQSTKNAVNKEQVNQNTNDNE